MKLDVHRQDIYMDEKLVDSDVRMEDLIRVKESWKRNGCPDHLEHLATTGSGNTYLFSIYYGLEPHEETPETVHFSVNHIVTTEDRANFPSGFHLDSSRERVGEAVGYTSNGDR